MQIRLSSFDNFMNAVRAEQIAHDQVAINIYITDTGGFNVGIIPAFVFSVHLSNITLWYSEYYNGYWQCGSERLIRKHNDLYTEFGITNAKYIRDYSLSGEKDEILNKYLKAIIENKE